MQPAGCPCVFGFVSTLVSTLDSACLWGRASFWCILTWQFLQSELDFSLQLHVNSLWVCWQTVQGWILVYNSYVGNKCVWYLMEIFWPMLQWKLMLNFVKAFVPCTFFFFFFGSCLEPWHYIDYVTVSPANWNCWSRSSTLFTVVSLTSSTVPGTWSDSKYVPSGLTTLTFWVTAVFRFIDMLMMLIIAAVIYWVFSWRQALCSTF